MPKEEIPRGQLSNIILSTLIENDKYGYEIIDNLKKRTNGNLNIKQPSLYSCLRRMEEQGLISSYWRDSEIGGRRHYYSITDYGKKYAEKWQTDINVFSGNNNSHFEERNVSSKSENNENLKTSTILQQENLFSLNNNNEEKKEVKNDINSHSFVQFDLFTSPSLISEPSSELFDSIKQLRESANNQPSLTNESAITNLRNKSQEDIKTYYEAPSKEINENKNNSSIKKDFYELAKNQKSFVSALKDNKIDDDIEQVFGEHSVENLLNKSEIKFNSLSNNQNINIYNNDDGNKDCDKLNNLNISELNHNYDNNITNHNIENYTENKDTIVEEKPTIYQTTNKDEYYNFDTDKDEQIDFIDLTENANLDKSEFLVSSEQTENTTSEALNKNQEKNKDFNISATTDANQNILNDNVITEQQNKIIEQNNLTKKDDAVLITDKPDFTSIPKVKKIAPARFESYAKNYNNNISNVIANKIAENKMENDLQHDSQKYEQTSNKVVQNYNDLTTLKKYYNSYDIKFEIYKKQNNLKNGNYIKVNKMNLLSSIIILSLIIIESLIFFCTYKNIQSSWNWFYLIFPIIAVGLCSYFIIKYFISKNAVINKSNIYNGSIIYSIIIFIVLIMSTFSINLLCGMELNSYTQYVTTFIYPCCCFLNYPIFKAINLVLAKTKFVIK